MDYNFILVPQVVSGTCARSHQSVERIRIRGRKHPRLKAPIKLLCWSRLIGITKYFPPLCIPSIYSIKTRRCSCNEWKTCISINKERGHFITSVVAIKRMASNNEVEAAAAAAGSKKKPRKAPAGGPKHKKGSKNKLSATLCDELHGVIAIQCYAYVCTKKACIRKTSRSWLRGCFMATSHKILPRTRKYW